MKNTPIAIFNIYNVLLNNNALFQEINVSSYVIFEIIFIDVQVLQIMGHDTYIHMFYLRIRLLVIKWKYQFKRTLKSYN